MTERDEIVRLALTSELYPRERPWLSELTALGNFSMSFSMHVQDLTDALDQIAKDMRAALTQIKPFRETLVYHRRNDNGNIGGK